MKIRGFILAGGYGTRMQVLSDCKFNRFAVAKPALPIGIRSQVRQQLYLLHLMGIEQAAVAVKFKPESVIEAIGNTSNFTMQVDVFNMNEHQVEDWGAAWTTYRWFSSLAQKPDKMVVLNGDILWDKTLASPFVRAFTSSSALGQIVGCSTPLEQLFGRFGLIQTDLADSGSVRKIKAFLEKPTADRYRAEMGNIANVGIFGLDSNVFVRFANVFGKDFADFASHLFQRGMVEHDLSLEAYIAPPGFYWRDIGTPLDLLQANFDVLNGRIDAGPQGTEVKPGVWIGSEVVIPDQVLQSIRGPMIIADEVEIGRNVQLGPNVIIGRGWKIEDHAKISNSILFPSYYETDMVRLVERGAVVDHCIVAGGTVWGNYQSRNGMLVVAPDLSMAFHGYDFASRIII